MTFIPAAKAALAGALLATGSAASAATVLFVGGAGGLGAGQTNYADFDTTFGNQSGVSAGSGVFAASVAGVAANPATGNGVDPDSFFAVLGGGTATFSFAQAVGIFGFDLGSSDEYNTLTLNFVNGPSQSFTGEQLNLAFDANGNQIDAGNNGRVTFSSFGDRITSVTFSSRQNSFEFDNLGIGAIPEPSVWAMLILGFGVIGGSLRRRTAKGWAARAALV